MSQERSTKTQLFIDHTNTVCYPYNKDPINLQGFFFALGYCVDAHTFGASIGRNDNGLGGLSMRQSYYTHTNNTKCPSTFLYINVCCTQYNLYLYICVHIYIYQCEYRYCVLVLCRRIINFYSVLICQSLVLIFLSCLLADEIFHTECTNIISLNIQVGIVFLYITAQKI